MYRQIIGLRVASAVFAIACLGQLVRLVLRPDLQLAGHAIPLWPSALAVVVFGALSFWMWELSRRAIR